MDSRRRINYYAGVKGRHRIVSMGELCLPKNYYLQSVNALYYIECKGKEVNYGNNANRN